MPPERQGFITLGFVLLRNERDGRERTARAVPNTGACPLFHRAMQDARYCASNSLASASAIRCGL